MAMVPEPVMTDVAWDGDVRQSISVGHWLQRQQSQWQRTRPYGVRQILLVVLRATRADLRRRLIQSEPEDPRLPKLTVVGGTHVLPAAGGHVLGDPLQRVQLLAAVCDLHGRPEDHDRAVIHRVMERGASEHQAILDRDGDADWNAA